MRTAIAELSLPRGQIKLAKRRILMPLQREKTLLELNADSLLSSVGVSKIYGVSDVHANIHIHVADLHTFYEAALQWLYFA